jgi:DNA-binding protein H-NS
VINSFKQKREEAEAEAVAKTIEAFKKAKTIEDLMVDKQSAKLVKLLVAALKEGNQSKKDVAAGKWYLFIK